MSFFKKFFTSEKKETLDKGLDKTRTSVFEKISRAVAGKSKLDDDTLDEIEEALITSDVGLDTTVKIIEALEERVTIAERRRNTSRDSALTIRST